MPIKLSANPNINNPDQLAKFLNNPDQVNTDLLDASNSFINFESLIKILYLTKALETLNLSYSKGLANFAPCYTPFVLSNLKSIIIDNSDIADGNIIKLIQISPNLEKLSAVNCNSIKNKTVNMGLDLFKLSKLDLSDNHIDFDHLEKFCLQTPNLKELDLKNWTNFDGDISKLISCLNKLNLKSLDLSETNISFKNLMLIINSCKINKITLVNCKYLNDIYIPNKSDATFLVQNFFIYNSNISIQNLSYLLKLNSSFRICVMECKEITPILSDILCVDPSLTLKNPPLGFIRDKISKILGKNNNNITHFPVKNLFKPSFIDNIKKDTNDTPIEITPIEPKKVEDSTKDTLVKNLFKPSFINNIKKDTDTPIEIPPIAPKTIEDSTNDTFNNSYDLIDPIDEKDTSWEIIEGQSNKIKPLF